MVNGHICENVELFLLCPAQFNVWSLDEKEFFVSFKQKKYCNLKAIRGFFMFSQSILQSAASCFSASCLCVCRQLKRLLDVARQDGQLRFQRLNLNNPTAVHELLQKPHHVKKLLKTICTGLYFFFCADYFENQSAEKGWLLIFINPLVAIIFQRVSSGGQPGPWNRK